MRLNILKKILILFISIVVIDIIVFRIATTNKKEFLNPIYNEEIITSINDIEIKNKKIKSKYQFVFFADLHASVVDDMEENEQIRNSLKERNDYFTELNKNKIKADEIFSEIIAYTNNKNADALLLGGDIIDSPADSNIKLLKENLQEYHKNYLYTLGNHDWSFAWDYNTEKTNKKQKTKFKEFIDDIQVSYLEYKDLIIMAVDNSNGRIEKETVGKIKYILEKKKQTIVMLHIPIATEYIASEEIKIRNRLSVIGESGVEPDEDTRIAIDLILSDEYNVFYVIAGHVHFSARDSLNDRIFQTVSAPAYEGAINVIKINN